MYRFIETLRRTDQIENILCSICGPICLQPARNYIAFTSDCVFCLPPKSGLVHVCYVAQVGARGQYPSGFSRFLLLEVGIGYILDTSDRSVLGVGWIITTVCTVMFALCGIMECACIWGCGRSRPERSGGLVDL